MGEVIAFPEKPPEPVEMPLPEFTLDVPLPTYSSFEEFFDAEVSTFAAEVNNLGSDNEEQFWADVTTLSMRILGWTPNRIVDPTNE